MKKTYIEIASNYDAWQEYADPHAEGTREEFDAMTLYERISALETMFGLED